MGKKADEKIEELYLNVKLEEARKQTKYFSKDKFDEAIKSVIPNPPTPLFGPHEKNKEYNLRIKEYNNYNGKNS